MFVRLVCADKAHIRDASTEVVCADPCTSLDTRRLSSREEEGGRWAEGGAISRRHAMNRLCRGVLGEQFSGIEIRGRESISRRVSRP